MSLLGIRKNYPNLASCLLFMASYTSILFLIHVVNEERTSGSSEKNMGFYSDQETKNLRSSLDDKTNSCCAVHQQAVHVYSHLVHKRKP